MHPAPSTLLDDAGDLLASLLLIIGGAAAVAFASLV
jgi:hypothetical protein